MERWVDVHSSHGGAKVVNGGVPMTAVDKMVNQPGTKHHGIMAKLIQDFVRSEAHRRATATVKRMRRRRCRPRGRKAMNDGSQRSQATRACFLGAQGTSGAMASLAKDGNALRRRRELDGAAAAVTGKNRGGEEKNGDDAWAINATRKQREATQGPSPC